MEVPYVNYDFQLSTDADFTVLVAEESNSSNTMYTPAKPLDPGTDYFWRVRSRRGKLTGAWNTGSFTTLPTEPAGNAPWTVIIIAIITVTFIAAVLVARNRKRSIA